MISQIKERPILFSAPMVRAILKGHKTQTRRIVKPQPPALCRYEINGNRDKACCIFDDSNLPGGIGFCPPTPKSTDHLLPCPHGQPGDHLWVRETFCQKCEDGHFVYNAENNLDSSCCWYRADGVEVRKDDGDGGTQFNKDGSLSSPWTPSIHMPRWASRITLEITNIRVERLNAITEDDALAEGIEPTLMNDATTRFINLWTSINGDGSWDANPFVWVIEFKGGAK